MLTHIHLRDFVIVRELQLDLSAGFSVLTGETGAGKSILIDALQLALGNRADTGVVREGAARAEISAQFDAPASLQAWLQEAGFESESSLLLRRSIDAQGKSRAWINGSAATLAQLREVAEHLVDIHGQHAWAQLTQTAELRRLLDAYGRIDASDVAIAHATWREAVKALEEARAAQATLDSERERLSWQLSELNKLAPQSDEWVSLNAEHSLQSHAQDLLQAAHSAVEHLEGDSGASQRLAQALELLQKNEHLAQEFSRLGTDLASNLAQIDDIARSLHAFTRKSAPDPARLTELDERVSLWLQLARRFRRTPEELPELLAQWQTQFKQLEAASDLGALERSAQTAQEALKKACLALSKQRSKAAPQLGNSITTAMQGLGMQGGKFEVRLTACEPTAYGAETVEFLVAGHAGSTPRAIGKVASGGELSRIALAIAVTTSKLGSAGTLIFDEVDSGIGGAVAETVGRLMKQLGQDRQVLAVTHLPQVAACADQHLLVAKQQVGKLTESSVKPIAGEARVSEVARMLGGEKLSNTTLAHAKEMLGAA
ncbi:MAG: DNA repair protein RecN [Brachymonas sp.]|nr:DNA repair protein RecN [Brachymonas sp.]